MARRKASSSTPPRSVNYNAQNKRRSRVGGFGKKGFKPNALGSGGVN